MNYATVFVCRDFQCSVIVFCISICVFTVLNLLYLNTLSYRDYRSLEKFTVDIFM